MERGATDTSFWRRLLSGDWRVSATILAFVAFWFCVPVARLIGIHVVFAPLIAVAIVGIGSWWLVPERRQRRR